MESGQLVIGHHGCDAGLAKQLVLGQTRLRRSENDWDWLGNGVYFWENNYERAMIWAADEATRPGSAVSEPAVVGAVISLGFSLNLTETTALKEVAEAHDYYLKLCESGSLNLTRNRGPSLRARYLDCMVFETLHQLRSFRNLPLYDTVRGFFMEGQPLYEGAGLRMHDHIQICVRNPATIIGYFLPKQS